MMKSAFSPTDAEILALEDLKAFCDGEQLVACLKKLMAGDYSDDLSDDELHLVEVLQQFLLRLSPTPPQTD